jgi:hypothetical protein
MNDNTSTLEWPMSPLDDFKSRYPFDFLGVEAVIYSKHRALPSPIAYPESHVPPNSSQQGSGLEYFHPREEEGITSNTKFPTEYTSSRDLVFLHRIAYTT